MKTKSTLFSISLILMLFAMPFRLHAQFGRVLVNEYLPWPNNACSATAEFVELLNMGPGPVDIGCYVLTDGDFTITIPAGTILQPGQFFVVAGQAVIPPPCGSFSRTVVANLNWNTCGCANASIPVFAPGWMTDGGFANEQIVLLSPTGQVVDAIVRNLPQEPSSLLNSRTMAGCPPRLTFDLDLLSFIYETVGESTGRGNSIARKLDGDCGWVKDTQQSAGETNNTPGERASFTMSMYITEDIFCTGGTARFVVDQNPASNWFPLDYILGYDSDGDGQFTFFDTYTTGFDYTAPDLVISNLPFGLYAINIGPAQGCSYQNFTFSVGPCIPLGYSLQNFTADKLGEDIRFGATINGANELNEVVLEGSTNGRDFFRIITLGFASNEGTQDLSYWLNGNTEYTYFRLMLADRNHKAMYSQIRKISAYEGPARIKLAGNPVASRIRMFATSPSREKLEIEIFNAAGQLMHRQSFSVIAGNNTIEVPADKLRKGLYFVRARMGTDHQESFKIMKQ